MKDMTVFQFMLIGFLSLIFCCSPIAHGEVYTLNKVGAKVYGCFANTPSNLLVDLSANKNGKLLVFSNEIKHVKKRIAITKKGIASLHSKIDSKSKALSKKLKKKLAQLKLLKLDIIACRDGASTQTEAANCADISSMSGAACDDLNPCTSADQCTNGVCVGTPVSTTLLNCSYGACAKVITQCAAGKFIPCFTEGAGEELCNSLDDDCNGQIDDGVSCPTPSPTPNSTPSDTPTPSSTPTATPTSSPTATPTATPTPPLPQMVVCGSTSNTIDLNPDGCPCSTNFSCVGVCPVLSVEHPVRICLGGGFCSIPNNNLNLSPDGCSCVSNNDCMGVCSFGVCTGGGITGCAAPGSGWDFSQDGCDCQSNMDCIGVCILSTHKCAGGS